MNEYLNPCFDSIIASIFLEMYDGKSLMSTYASLVAIMNPKFCKFATRKATLKGSYREKQIRVRSSGRGDFY